MPILVGASRKSFIGYMQGLAGRECPDGGAVIPAPADERLYGTLGNRGIFLYNGGGYIKGS